MTSRLKSIPCRHVFVLTALFLTFTLAGWALENGGPVVLPATNPAPAVDLPDSGNVKDASASSDTKSDLPLPIVKPIIVHADRDAAIGRLIGELLEQDHYSQRPIDQEMSQRWLKNYFLALDPTHLFFLQSDIDEFTTKYGNTLGERLLHSDNEEAAVMPAFEIFNRYMQRVDEDVVLAEKLIHDKYDFTKNETFTVRTDKSTWLPDAATSAAVWQGQIKADLLTGLLDKKPPEKTMEHVSKRYVSLLRDRAELEEMDVVEYYLSALTHAYDPHSDYYAPEEAEDFNIQAIDHAVTGIGAMLKTTDDGYAAIEEVIAGGPADLDKRLQPGDKIIAVGQGNKEPIDAASMSLKHVVSMIRGVRGSIVHLVILPVGAAEGALPKDILLKRDVVSIKDSLAKADIIDHPLPGGGMEKIGIIDLHDFYNRTSADVAKLVQRLKKEKVAGIILDVRNNGGGLLDQAVDLTGLFVKDEPVVQIRRFDGHIDKLGPEETRQIYDGPLLVMVNKASASATEIVAGALQDYGRAIIVGDQSTHGKGTVQTLLPLDQSAPIGFIGDPGKLKLTVQKFYRVAGGSTQQKGVVPDIVLPSLLDAFELGETTLPYYLPYDTVPPATFSYLNLTAAYLPALRTNSTTRVAASQDFAYLRQDIDFYKKKVQDKTISLNEAARLKEQDDMKALMAQRKKDLEARKASRDKMLELTLDMVDHNLPPAPPVVKKPKIDPDDSDSSGEPNPDDAINNPTDDPQLDEAVKIMCDYTSMLHDSGSTLVQAAPATVK